MPASARRKPKQAHPSSRTKRPRATGPRVTSRNGRSIRRKTQPAEAVFPALMRSHRRYGVGVFLAVAEQQGTEGEVQYLRLERFFGRPGRRPRSRLMEQAQPDEAARMLAGLAHAERIRVARAILSGAHTHLDLSEATGLKTGPLYHHIRTLERAGLVAITGRNQYELTAAGRWAILITSGLVAATTNGRQIKRIRLCSR